LFGRACTRNFGKLKIANFILSFTLLVHYLFVIADTSRTKPKAGLSNLFIDYPRRSQISEGFPNGKEKWSRLDTMEKDVGHGPHDIGSKSDVGLVIPV
jgi:hypothetical protein